MSGIEEFFAAMAASMGSAGGASAAGGAAASTAAAAGTAASVGSVTAATVGEALAASSAAGIAEGVATAGALGSTAAATGLTTAQMLGLGSTLLSTSMGAVESKKAGDANARALRQQAKSERASAQYAANEERRQARFAQSRAQAAGAASGAVGVGMENAIADLAGEGEYRALMRMRNGYSAAATSSEAAQVASNEGRATAATTLMKGGATLLNPSPSIDWLEKYG